MGLKMLKNRAGTAKNIALIYGGSEFFAYLCSPFWTMEIEIQTIY